MIASQITGIRIFPFDDVIMDRKAISGNLYEGRYFPVVCGNIDHET